MVLEIILATIGGGGVTSIVMHFLNKKSKDKVDGSTIDNLAAQASEKIAQTYTILFNDLTDRLSKLEAEQVNSKLAEQRCYDRELKLNDRVTELEKENRQLLKEVGELKSQLSK